MKLQKGDTIGLIALAGDCDKESVGNAVLRLQELGYEVKLSKNIYDKNRYLSGTDEDKLNELYEFFTSPEIKIIINARGGYGAIRLVNNIDYEIIKRNPKQFVGYSDITALLLMIYKKTGLVTYHGPMGVNFGVGINNYTYGNFVKALSGDRLKLEGNKIYKSGDACGVIWGGNLATVASMCGLDFIPDEDFIFFTEDINEPVYKIDRMFTQLFNVEKFRDKCKGIVLGDFVGVDNEAWLEEFLKELPVPAVGGFKISHIEENTTIPIGRYSKLSGTTLVIK